MASMQLRQQASGVFSIQPIRIDLLECPDFLEGLSARFFDAALWRFGDAIDPPEAAKSLMAMSRSLQEMANEAYNRVEDGTSQWHRAPRVDGIAFAAALRQARAA